MKTITLDQRFVGRESSPLEIEIIGSEGSYLIASHGRKYIDFFAGWCVGNLGWANEEIRESVRAFDGPDYVPPAFLYKGWAELAECLASVAPGKLKKSYRATGGTEAVEIALQAAMIFTGRSEFVAIEGAYHGDGVATTCLAGSEEDVFDGMPFRVHHLEPPLGKQTLPSLEKVLKTEKVAALVMEPVICNLGVEVPDLDFMEGAQRLCLRYGTLFILDEVACGFGRTGKLFATEHFGVEPDMLCLGKAITGGFGVMGATMMTEKTSKKLEDRINHYSTYGWYPASVEAALATLRYYLKHRARIEKNVAEMSSYFEMRLNEIPFRHPADVRVKGLAIGIEFKKKGYATEIVDQARDKGLLLSEQSGELFTIFPALTLERKVAEEGLDILESCVGSGRQTHSQAPSRI